MYFANIQNKTKQRGRINKKTTETELTEPFGNGKRKTENCKKELIKTISRDGVAVCDIIGDMGMMKKAHPRSPELWGDESALGSYEPIFLNG